MFEEVPVVIVGGGPIGLTLSCILGRSNIGHVLLEKNETTSKWAKAMVTNTRSMELLRQLGLDTILREEELQFAHHRAIIGHSLMNEKPIMQLLLAQMAGKNPRLNPDASYSFDEEWTAHPILRLSQIFIEPALKKAAMAYESSEIKFGWQVQSISQTPDKVIVEAVNAKTGERKVYHAQYAVGCDGGKSFVRKSLGIRFKGEFDLADMKSISYESTELKDRLSYASDVIGSVTVRADFQAFTLPLNEEGLFVSHFFRGADKNAKPEDTLRTLMDNEELSYNIVLVTDWQGHFASAETLQQGRVFLAGDACHIMIPIGGFGMNTGILDAFDLGWKLVATLKGWGGEKLLESYTAERLPAIEKLLDRIRRMFKVFQRFAPMFGFLVSTRPFSYIMRMFFESANVNIGISGILFGLRLDSSPLCIPSGIPLPPEDPVNYTPTAFVGCRAPHYQFEDGTTLYDKLGSAFTLLHLQPSNQSYDPIVSAAAHCGVPLKVVRLQDKKLKTLYREMDFVLIRPDLYIAWCGNEIPTLLHNEDTSEGAKVLMKVVTGATDLPLEWQTGRKRRHTVRTLWWLPLLMPLFVGAIAASLALLRRYNWIQ